MSDHNTMTKLTVILTLLVSIAAEALGGVENNEVVDTYLGVPIYKMDPQCAMVGGFCVQKSDCVLLTSKSGLCPSSQHLGVECCYEIPTREGPCQEHLGACTQGCPSNLQRPATDCPDGEVCCVLI